MQARAYGEGSFMHFFALYKTVKILYTSTCEPATDTGRRFSYVKGWNKHVTFGRLEKYSL